MNYEITCLYSYTSKEGDPTDRYLLTFYNDNNVLKNVEFDVFNKDSGSVLFINKQESDYLTQDDEDLLYYILDCWSINHLI